MTHMLQEILFVLVTALFVFAYHYERNGTPLSYGPLFSRLFWSGSFAFGYLALALTSVHIYALIAFFIATYLTLLVPHAAFQNMGTWATPQKTWPGFFLPTLTQDQWGAMSMVKRTLYDFAGMASVGVIRGGVVFVPALFLGVSFFGALFAMALTGLGQPLSYLIGRFIPFAMWGNTPKSTSWGEFLVGASWAVALASAVWL